MFESAAPGRICPPQEYETLSNTLRLALFKAQQDARASGIPVVISIGGVDGTGRGAVVNLLSEWMDAKGIRNHVFWTETDEERNRPEEWKFWRRLPGTGEIGVFLGGWYGGAIRRFCCGEMEKETFDLLMHRRIQFEQMLAASGMVIVKLWLHIGKEEHKKCLKSRLKNRTVHHFTPYDRESARHYKKLVEAAGRAISLTDRVGAPWTIIDAHDAHFRNISVAKAVIAAIEHAVEQKRIKETRTTAKVVSTAEKPQETRHSVLDAVDLSRTCPPEVYGKELKRLQAELSDLTYRAYRKGISSTLLFEGWDAAGKGGAIRRLTAGIDARITRVIPVSAPTDEELAHHYLWRFWRHVPMAGFITVYDRSWYGRVLVERVERLTAPEDWKRAYAELNDFESRLLEHGNVLVKYWLHISSDEQLRRFRERENTPWKRYKITQEDWRNREKREAYLEAADEMFLRTDTEQAPWHIVPAEDKKLARLEVLRIYRDALEKALRRN